MRPDTAVRIGILALPGSALLFLTVLLRGPFVWPRSDGFAVFVTSAGYDIWTSGTINGLVWLVFGTIALHTALGRMGASPRPLFFGAAFLIAGLTTGLLVMGVLTVAWPAAAEAGQARVAAAMQEDLTYRVWAPFSLATSGLGAVLLAVCMWGTPLPKWAPIAFGVGGVGVLLPWWYPVEAGATVLWALACFGISWSVWRSPANKERSTPPLRPPSG